MPGVRVCLYESIITQTSPDLQSRWFRKLLPLETALLEVLEADPVNTPGALRAAAGHVANFAKEVDFGERVALVSFHNELVSIDASRQLKPLMTPLLMCMASQLDLSQAEQLWPEVQSLYKHFDDVYNKPQKTRTGPVWWKSVCCLLITAHHFGLLWSDAEGAASGTPPSTNASLVQALLNEWSGSIVPIPEAHVPASGDVSDDYVASARQCRYLPDWNAADLKGPVGRQGQADTPIQPYSPGASATHRSPPGVVGARSVCAPSLSCCQGNFVLNDA